MPSLVVLVLHDLSHLEEALAAWHDAGATSVTTFDALGTRTVHEQARREDLPILPSIRDLLQSDDAPRRVVFTVVADELVDALIAAAERVLGELSEAGNGIVLVLPVARAAGLR